MFVAVLASSCADSNAPVTSNAAPTELLGLGSTPSELTAIQAADRNTMELAVQSCMKEQGFGYEPVVQPVTEHAASSLDEGTLEYAERFGYGILAGFEETAIAPFFADSVNNSAVDLMADSEFLAWISALTGLNPDEFDALTNEITDSEVSLNEMSGLFVGKGGCIDEGSAASNLAQTWALMDQHSDALIALEASITSDDRIAALDQRWGDCMAEAGFIVSDTGQARAPFNDYWVSAYAQLEFNFDEFGEPFVLGFEPEELDEQLVEERRVAVQDWKCEEPLKVERQTLRALLNAEFWAENGDVYRALDNS